MGRVSCVVKLRSFKWRRGGYAEVENSGAVQSVVAREARKVEERANASFKRKHGEGRGYRASACKGRFSKGYRVRPVTPHAINSENVHHRLG